MNVPTLYPRQRLEVAGLLRKGSTRQSLKRHHRSVLRNCAASMHPVAYPALGSKDHQKQLRYLNYYRNYRRYGASATCVRRRVRSGNAPTLSPLPTRFYQCFWGYQMQPLVFFRQTLDIA